jgi:hypothetical protein
MRTGVLVQASCQLEVIVNLVSAGMSDIHLFGSAKSSFQT